MAKDVTKSETANTGAASRAEQRSVRTDSSNRKSAYCNFFVAQNNPTEVVLNFGFNQNPRAPQRNMQVELLHQVILHPATARQLKDTLIALFNKRDAPRVRANVAPAAPKKAS